MTPAKKKAAPKSANVKAKNATRDVVVSRDNSEVVIDWPANCGGGTRMFTPEGLRADIANVERVAALGDDVWYEGTDADGRTFYCRLADGRLHAHDHIGDDIPHVSWSVFKRAMEARIKA
jgi:hypothetical protein